MDSFRNIQVATVDCSACGYFAPLINAAHLLGGPHTGAHCGGHLVQSSTTIHPSLLYLYGLAPAPPPAPQSDEAGYQAPYNQRAKEVAEPAHPLPSNVNVPSTDNSLALVHRVNPAPEPAKIRPPQWRKHATQSFYELWWNGKKWNIEPWEKYVANFDNKGKFLTREEHDPFARARKYKDEVPALKATDLPDYPPLKEKARARLIKLGQIVSKQKDRTKKKTTQIAPRQDVKVELAGKIVSTQEAKKLKKEKHDRLVILKKASTDGDAYCWKCRRLGHMASRCKFLEEHGKAKFTVFDHSFNPLPLASAGFYEKMKYRQPDHFAFIIMHVSAVGESLDGVEAFVEFRDHLQSRMWKCLNTRNQEKAATFLFMCCSLDLLTRKVILDYQHCVQVFVSWMFKELTENKLCSPTLKKSENVMKLYADKESTKGVWPSIFKKACQLKIDVEKIKEAYLDAKSIWSAKVRKYLSGLKTNTPQSEDYWEGQLYNILNKLTLILDHGAWIDFISLKNERDLASMQSDYETWTDRMVMSWDVKPESEGCNAAPNQIDHLIKDVFQHKPAKAGNIDIIPPPARQPQVDDFDTDMEEDDDVNLSLEEGDDLGFEDCTELSLSDGDDLELEHSGDMSTPGGVAVEEEDPFPSHSKHLTS